jgi:hypothetical protein
MSFKDSLLGGLAGAIGTVAVGAIFSNATLNFMMARLGSSVLPPGAVILSNASDCGGSQWQKLDQAAGRFLVASGASPVGNVTYQAGFQGMGVTTIKLQPNNLPPLNLTINFDQEKANFPNGGYAYTTGLTDNPTNLHGTYNIHAGGTSDPIDVTPPWYGVTPCVRR